MNEEIVTLIPGRYEVSYKLKTDYGDIAESKDMEFLEDGDINVEVAAEYITCLLYTSRCV